MACSGPELDPPAIDKALNMTVCNAQVGST